MHADDVRTGSRLAVSAACGPPAFPTSPSRRAVRARRQGPGQAPAFVGVAAPDPWGLAASADPLLVRLVAGLRDVRDVVSDYGREQSRRRSGPARGCSRMCRAVCSGFPGRRPPHPSRPRKTAAGRGFPRDPGEAVRSWLVMVGDHRAACGARVCGHAVSADTARSRPQGHRSGRAAGMGGAAWARSRSRVGRCSPAGSARRPAYGPMVTTLVQREAAKAAKLTASISWYGAEVLARPSARRGHPLAVASPLVTPCPCCAFPPSVWAGMWTRVLRAPGRSRLTGTVPVDSHAAH